MDHVLDLLLFCTLSAHAFCPPPGPILPPPVLRTGPSTSLIANSVFESLPYNSDSSYTIKAAIGSTDIFHYSYTAPAYAESRSVYDTQSRIASVSKLFTVLAVILSVDKIGWENSIKDYIPELKGDVWDDVTISALAAQTSGLGKFVGSGACTLKCSGADSRQGIRW
jgi:hypothetical protein